MITTRSALFSLQIPRLNDLLGVELGTNGVDYISNSICTMGVFTYTHGDRFSLISVLSPYENLEIHSEMDA